MDRCSAFEADINECLKSCTSSAMSSGPIPRWQKKLQGQARGTPLSPLNISRNKSICTATTPGKTTAMNMSTKKKTPGKNTSLNKSGNTSCSTYDRFIPNRALMDNEKSHQMLMMDGEEDHNPDVDIDGASLDRLTDGSESSARILAMRCKAPTATDGYKNKVLHSISKKPPAKWTSRHIPDTPERILDAPDITNDYYLNIMDWGSNNCIGVALGSEVFVWQAQTGKVDRLMQTEDDEIVTSVKWIGDGNIIALGLDNGTVEIWDAESCQKKRSMAGHMSRVGSLSWNEFILSSGSRSGAIHQHDVRIARHNVASLLSHSQEVCGLAWSPNGKQLASGGNDNILNIWDVNLQSSGEINTPMHSLADHCAAVKAVSWCPWQHNVLASGGGTADRHIRIWNSNTGVCLQSVDTQSQISSILWSEEHKELMSGHGFSENQLTIWKYPSMNRVTQLLGHTSRVLNLAQSPDQTIVASAGADQTIRIWHCFAAEQKKKPKAKAKNGNLRLGIR